MGEPKKVPKPPRHTKAGRPWSEWRRGGPRLFGQPTADPVKVVRGAMILQLDQILLRPDGRLGLILRAVEAAGVLARADPETAP